MKAKDFKNYVFAQLGGVYEWLSNLEDRIKDLEVKK